MGQALYRQYRPKSLADVVGQEHITSTLLHALKQGKLAHAYLFTGPRGVGKTSIARIMAHEINGLPYEDDATHLDIIEIDAASNRRIDEIRDLRDKVHTAPTSAKYKVYIIDEVHMLTREAFNALLKTLEEPPAHAVFILATTESHKLPETIVSRTQRFIFRPVSMDKVIAHLRHIADTEGISISDEALELVANHGEGSFRDSISLLDQTRGHDGTVDADVVRSLIGVPTTEAIDKLLSALASADAPTLVQTLSELREKGFAAPQVAKHLGQRLRADVLAGNGQAGVFELMAKLLEVPTAHNPESHLELSLLSHALAATLPAPAAAPSQPTASAPEQPSRPSQASAAPTLSIQTKLPPRPPAATVPKPPEPEPIVEAPQQLGEPIAVDERLWPEILNSLKKTHNTLYGIARMARPTFYEDGLELAFTFAFHKKRISEAKNKDVIVNIMKELTGKGIALNCVLISKDSPAPAPIAAAPSAASPVAMASANNDPSLSAISNIFGGAEVLES
jgi:DNA polymerase-3 subunit gamma/tau